MNINAPIRHFVAAALLLSAIATTACDSPTGPNDDPGLQDSQVLQGNNVLVFQNAGGLAEQRGAIESMINNTLTAVRALIALDNVTIIVRGSTDNVIAEIGVGGRAQRNTVSISIDPASMVLDSAVDSWLFPILVHEFHHVARIRTAGYGDNLLGAMISEGLADQFAIEVAGIAPPPWSVALTPDLLVEWSANAQVNWFNAGYNHEAWFFGTGNVPRWAGYSIGFDMTSRFMQANPGRLASDLVAEPATSFTGS